MGVHHIALGLGHLIPVEVKPPVAVDLFGQGQLHAHQERGPVDGVEAHDLLAHKMGVGGPEPLHIAILPVLITQGGHIVEQRVQPHINHMARVEVHRHPPGEGGPGHAQVLKPALAVDEVVHHLVHPALGLQEVGVQQQLPHPAGVLGGPEEVRLLLRVHHLPAAVGALAVLELALRPEGLAGLAVLALVGPLVDIALVVHLLENPLDGLHMVAVGGADEAVVGDVHQLPQVQHAAGGGHNVVHELLGGDPRLPGLVLNLLAVLVGAGEEHHVIAAQPLVPCHGVGGHGAVGVADVQPAGGIVDGGSDIKALVFHGKTSCQSQRMGKITIYWDSIAKSASVYKYRLRNGGK